MYFILTGSNFLILFFLASFLAVVMPEGLPWANSSNENKHWSSFKAHLEAVLCNLAVWSLSRSTGWPHIRTWAYNNIMIITRSILWIKMANFITRNIQLIASGQSRFTSWELLGGGKWNLRGFRWGCHRSSSQFYDFLGLRLDLST